MKKRIFALVCVVVLCLAYMSVGFAANCAHGNIVHKNSRTYVKIDDKTHKYINNDYEICTSCGTTFNPNITTLFTEKHTHTGSLIEEVRGIYKYTYYICDFCHGQCEVNRTYN